MGNSAVPAPAAATVPGPGGAVSNPVDFLVPQVMGATVMEDA